MKLLNVSQNKNSRIVVILDFAEEIEEIFQYILILFPLMAIELLQILEAIFWDGTASSESKNYNQPQKSYKTEQQRVVYVEIKYFADGIDVGCDTEQKPRAGDEAMQLSQRFACKRVRVSNTFEDKREESKNQNLA